MDKDLKDLGLQNAHTREHSNETRATCIRLKAAWIRRQDVPPGQPATGHFDCECGQKVESGHYGQGPDVACVCGLQYGNQGHIRGRSNPNQYI